MDGDGGVVLADRRDDDCAASEGVAGRAEGHAGVNRGCERGTDYGSSAGVWLPSQRSSLSPNKHDPRNKKEDILAQPRA